MTGTKSGMSVVVDQVLDMSTIHLQWRVKNPIVLSVLTPNRARLVGPSFFVLRVGNIVFSTPGVSFNSELAIAILPGSAHCTNPDSR